MLSGRTGMRPSLERAANVELGRIERRMLDGHIQKLYRATFQATSG